MERYHIYKLGLAILFYAVYFARQTVVNGLKIDDVTSTTNTTDYRERRDSGDDNAFFYQGADGSPGADFPTLSYVPRTKFSCRDMEAGYYADLEADCQVFHICDEGRKLSFLCPNGTIFHQGELICDWWFKVNCSNSPLLYEESAEILHRENAKRKDSRRLSYQGTKQGVFSSYEDYDYGQDKIRGTPAHFVTPSYPHRSSLKTIDNRISVTTEGSIRRNYNARDDRTLDSFGNGVREKDYDKTNQFSTVRGQNTFGVNLQGSSDNRGKASIGTGPQGSGRESTFGLNLQGKSGGRDQTAFSTSTRTQQKTSTAGQFSFDKNTQASSKSGGFGQSGFGLNVQGTSEAGGPTTFGTGRHQVAGGGVSQIPFDRSSQQSTNGRNQNIFGANLQEKPDNFGQSSFTKSETFGTGTRQKSDTFAGQIPFDRTSQKTAGEQSRNSFGPTFATGIQYPVDSSIDQTSSDRGQNIFGTRLQGSVSRAGHSNFGVNLQGKSEASGQVTFGTSTQQNAGSSASQIPLDRSSQQTISGRGQSKFGTSFQGKTTGVGQNIFGTNLQGKGANQEEVTIGASTQQKIRDEGGDSFYQNAHKGTTERVRETFSTNLQGLKENDKNKFNLNVQGKPGSGQFNVLDKSIAVAQEQATSLRPDGGFDKIKFSISSQGKADEFSTNKQETGDGHQQNIFGASGQNQLPDRDQTTISRESQDAIGGFGQNRFDINLQGKPGKYEQTTSTFGLKSSGSTRRTFSYTSQGEPHTDDSGNDDSGKIPVLIVSAETQEPQETASFVKSSRNNLLDKKQTTNPYPNHRETYSEIKDPRQYYQQSQSKLPEKPFYGSSVSPQVLSTVPVSAPDGSSKTTTEISPHTDYVGSNFGLRTDISTTKPSRTTFAPFRDNGQFSTDKSPVTTNRFSFGLSTPQTTKSSLNLNLHEKQVDVSTDRDNFDNYNVPTSTTSSVAGHKISNFEQNSIQPTPKSATIGSSKVDVTTYDSGYTNGVDVSLNSVSSTLSPDISSDIKGKSTVYPDSQRNKYYDGKLSTPAVGINIVGSSGARTTETDSRLIKLNIIPSTVSPGFESSTRTGKAFSVESPKTQVILHQGSKTEGVDKSPIDATGNVRDASTLSVSFGSQGQGLTGKPIIHKFTSGSQTISPGVLQVNGVSSSGNTFRVITGVGITPSVSFNRFGSTNTGTGISSRTSSTVATGFKNNVVSSTPSTINNIHLYTGPFQEKPTVETNRVEFTANKGTDNQPTAVGNGAVDIHINNRTYTSPTTDRVNLEVTSVEGRIGVDGSTSTRATPTETATVEFTINDDIFTTPASISTETINININNENYSTAVPIFSVTKQGGFGITTTTATPSKDQSTQNIPYTSTSGILQPKPFAISTEAPFVSGKIGITDQTAFEQPSTPKVPPYTISSASPFATTSKPSGESKTVTPTLPTPYTTESNSLYSYQPTDENVNNVINTLMEVVKQRFGGDAGFGTPRPGLVVPPSAGPQTLHTLAIYFANALDNLTSSSPREQPVATDEESGTNSPIIHIDNEELIKSLLTQMTLNNYDDLFKEKDTTTTELPFSLRTGADDSENDLIREDTKHPTEGPGVRQLARVFTEALSAYLEDPDTFKKVLHDVRPTEPPSLTFGNETESEEDEVLNYSDSDLKSDHPHLPTRPTGIPVSPTWGYILAFNKSSSTSDNVELQNSLSSDNENLQSADSQSLVSQLNKITQQFKTTLSLDRSASTTEASYTDATKEDSAKALPENHWTTSSDVTKLWQTTLSINPAVLNENFDSSPSGQGITSRDIDARFSGVTGSGEASGETTVVSEIQYELRSLPKIELNSTQVHGILIDFMNASKTEGSAKLQRLLHKLNISQDEFLDKMKEIEGNPLTRRLILLLISECNTDRNRELETRAASSDSVFGLAQSKLDAANTEQPTVTSRLETDSAVTTESNSFKHIVHPSLDDDDEDTRALELLNSLYVIASKFGK